MFTIDVPKDVRKYKSKFVGPFTFRQTICLVIAAACAYGGFYLQKMILGDEIDNGIICWICAAPGLLFGFLEPYGMELEKFLKSAFVSNVLSPSKRKYKPVNYLKKEIRKACKMAEEIEKKEEEELCKKDKQYRKDKIKNRKEMEMQRKRLDKEFIKQNPKYR